MKLEWVKDENKRKRGQILPIWPEVPDLQFGNLKQKHFSMKAAQLLSLDFNY